MNEGESFEQVFRDAFVNAPDGVIDQMMDELLRANIDVTKRSKEELVHNGPDDLPPMCVWYFADGTHVPIPVGQICDQVHDEPPNVLTQCLSQIRQQHGSPPAMAILGYEAWMHKGPNGEELPQDKPPGESIILIVATPRRALHAIIQFHYEGGVVWDDVTVADLPTSNLPTYGPMPTALYMAFTRTEAN